MAAMMTFTRLSDEEKYERFMQRIEAGEKIEADDWMPDEYRVTLIKLIAMHAVSEIMGALPEKEMGAESAVAAPQAWHHGESAG